jgi:hypothetical protein
MHANRDWTTWREKQTASPIYLPPQTPKLVSALTEYHN